MSAAAAVSSRSLPAGPSANTCCSTHAPSRPRESPSPAIPPASAAGFRRLEIGTGETGTGQIALYERCGFVRCGIDRDYFRKYYPAPIIENGIECRDMVRLGMELRPDAPTEG